MRSAKASGTALKPAELSVQLYLLLKISLRPLGLNLKVLTNTLSPQEELPLAIPMGFPYFLKILGKVDRCFAARVWANENSNIYNTSPN